MMKLPFRLILLCSVLLFLSCKKDLPESVDAAELSELIQDEMSKQHVPAMSVLVFQGEDVLYEEYFGKSHLGNNTALQADHPFLIASISKVVTATALLQLHEQNLFALDDPINDYLPFAVNVPGFSTKITFRMLLTHTSAIGDGPSLDDQYYYGVDSPVALGDFLQSYLVPGGSNYNANENFYNFEPGTDQEYSNTGAALVGYLVEVISGQDFNEYCKQHIFTPLGMVNTHWKLSEITGTIVQPYEYSGGNYDLVEHYTFTDFPNGGLRTTVRDMHRFFAAFVQNGTSQGHQLLASTTVAQMATLQVPGIDATTGLHMFVMDADKDLWGHDGGEMGVSTIAAFNMSTKVGAILFCNMSDVNLDDLLLNAYVMGTGE